MSQAQLIEATLLHNDGRVYFLVSKVTAFGPRVPKPGELEDVGSWVVADGEEYILSTPVAYLLKQFEETV